MTSGKLCTVARSGSVRQLLRVLALIAASCALFAQTDRGSIEGTVKDPNGAIVPAAKVQVVNIETNSRLDFESNETRTLPGSQSAGRVLPPGGPEGGV